ncbi:MAG: SIS domain-containing protein [Calditrichia bacterium]
MAIDWQKTVEKTILENIEVQKKLLEKTIDPIIRAAKQIGITIRKGGKILLCGNGGSAADAQHIAAELVVRLTSQNSRPAIAAQALTVDTSILTAASNDFGFEYVFSRQIEALASRDDTLIAISTSGNSGNVIEAVNMAHEKGLYVIGLLGGNGGKLEKLVDLPVIIPSAETARIQEAHALIGHILCDLAEQDLFS